MFMTTTATKAVGKAVTGAYLWASTAIKANNEARARQAAQLQAQVTQTNRAWWANLQAQARAYQNKQIAGSSAIPGSQTQLGLASDQASQFGNAIKVEHVVLGGALVLLLLMPKKKKG